MQFVNATPHDLKVTTKEGEVMVFSKTDVFARVASSVEEVENTSEYRTFYQKFGEIEGLPAPVDGVLYIVSPIVLSANAASKNPRKDLVAPATGHWEVKRNDQGNIISVPGFMV